EPRGKGHFAPCVTAPPWRFPDNALARRYASCPIGQPDWPMPVRQKETRMFAPANQTHFSLSLPAIEHDLQVLEFTGHEALSQPFVFELTLVSERPDLDLAAL